MEDITKLKISNVEKERLLIKNLNNRPNAMATYGQAKMSSTEAKDVFDKQFELTVKRHNELCDEVGAIAEEVERELVGANSAEVKRVEAEKSRSSAEAQRVTNETNRKNAEAVRVSNENTRKTAEIARNETVGALDVAVDQLIATQEALLNGEVESVSIVAYPVGAVYLNTNAANPAALFGGTWENIGTLPAPVLVNMWRRIA